MAAEEVSDGPLRAIRTGLFVAAGRVLQRMAGPSRLITRGVESGRIALTYDDGPKPTDTARVLKELEQQNAKATFFCVGSHARRHPTLLRELRQAGHEIGSHTNSHVSLMKVSSQQAFDDIREGREAIEDVLGEPCPLFRPPHGLIPPLLLRSVWKSGCTIVLWTVSTRDYLALPIQTLCNRIRTRGISSGDIVLLHDTSEAAPELTRTLCQLAEDQNLAATTTSALVATGGS